MLVGDFVARLGGRLQQGGGLSDAFAAGVGIEPVAGGVAGDGFGLPEPPIGRWRHRSLGGRYEMGRQRVDGGPGLRRDIECVVGHGYRFGGRPCSRFARVGLAVGRSSRLYTWGHDLRTSLMTDNPTLNRRRVLELSGVGTGIAVAGCMNQVDSGDGEGRQVTVALQIDQEEIQQRQRELQQKAITGNVSEEELQEEREEIRALQEEAVSDAVESAEAEFEDSGITIEDQLDGQGALLISGPDSDILDALETNVVQAMYAGSVFEQAQQQQQQQPTESDESTGE